MNRPQTKLRVLRQKLTNKDLNNEHALFINRPDSLIAAASPFGHAAAAVAAAHLLLMQVLSMHCA